MREFLFKLFDDITDFISVGCAILAGLVVFYSLIVTTIVMYMYYVYNLSWPHYNSFIQYALGGGGLSALTSGAMRMTSSYVNGRYNSPQGSPPQPTIKNPPQV